MNNTSMLGNGLERVLLLLLVGMASGLIVADSLNTVPEVTAQIQPAHENFLRVAMPASLSLDCSLPKDQAKVRKATCLLRIG
jgi:hypothetical protein